MTSSDPSRIFPPLLPSPPPPEARPSRLWRLNSYLAMGLVGSMCRGFLYGLNRMEVIGLDRLLETLDRRKDVEGRQRGLITVSNHVSVIDDPLIWGVLPLRYAFNPENHRWGLGSNDICFTNKLLSTFFSLGQVLPTHRHMHSPHGGLFQPTMTQAIRLLSAQPYSHHTLSPSLPQARPSMSLDSPDIIDPFSANALTYTTDGHDVFPAPSAYLNRAHSWIHIFPEGRIHQHPHKTMRYFKWGVSRLILESEPMPDIIPMFIDGTQDAMHESRKFPRFLPRVGKKIKIAFGEPVDGEQVFGDLRRRWQRLVELQKRALVKQGQSDDLAMGELTTGLKYADEAVALRSEVTKRIRLEVLKVRRDLGYGDEDPKNGLVDTWIEEGPKEKGKMADGSWVGDT